jgi:hypothetical protein
MHPIDEHNPTGLPEHIRRAVRPEAQIVPFTGSNDAQDRSLDEWITAAYEAQKEADRLRSLLIGCEEWFNDAICTLIDADHTDMNDRDGMSIARLQLRLESVRLQLLEALEAGQ